MNRERVQIRPADEADVPVILRFIRELAAEDGRSSDCNRSAFARVGVSEAESPCAFGGKKNGVACGFALYFYNFSTFLGRAGIYLEDLYVTPAARGKGIGKLLLQNLAAIAVREGCGRLEWACLDWNHPSIGFYRALGACPMDDWTTYRVTGETLRTLAGKTGENT